MCGSGHEQGGRHDEEGKGVGRKSSSAHGLWNPGRTL